jgi:hypothetical protein
MRIFLPWKTLRRAMRFDIECGLAPAPFTTVASGVREPATMLMLPRRGVGAQLRLRVVDRRAAYVERALLSAGRAVAIDLTTKAEHDVLHQARRRFGQLLLDEISRHGKIRPTTRGAFL